MLIQQILEKNDGKFEQILAKRARMFIEQSNGLCLLKNLPKSYEDFDKVKARKRNIKGDMVETFNQAFNDKQRDLFQKAIFANGQSSYQTPVNESHEPFYVFPINGFKFLYCTEVENSTSQYQQIFEMVLNQFGTDQGKQLLTDLMKFTYNESNLVEGINKGSEIIIYDIPYYYVVRESTFDYDDLLARIKKYT